MRTVGRGLLLGTTAVVLLAPFLPVAPSAARTPQRYTTTTYVAPGVVHRKIVAPAWPNRIHVLEIDPSTSATLDVGLATGSLDDRLPTSQIAARHDAVAAVNGTFVAPWGRPMGVFAQDGSLKTSALYREVMFVPAADEASYDIGYFPLRVTAANKTTGALPLRVDKWNETSLFSGEIGGYTPAGADHLSVPKDTCSVKLVKPSASAWGPGGYGVARVHTVGAVRCAWKPLTAESATVLAAKRGSAAARALRSFSVGDDVAVTWSVGLRHVFDVIGGSPRLVADGAIVAQMCDEYVCWRHPRTGVGLTSEGNILLVTVDGRQPKYSVGMNIVDFAREMRRQGAVDAVNMDGGGSTTMVIRGSVVNRPSGGRQRAVGNAILVLKGKDGTEPYLPWSLSQ